MRVACSDGSESSLEGERWRVLWHRAGLRGDAARCFEQLMGLYTEPHRAYHNGHHIAECLREFDSAEGLTNKPIAVELAIWFHDAIYDPRANENEERSAELAREQLSLGGASQALLEAVTTLIAATKHTNVPRNPDEQLLVDVDLSILGQSEKGFAEYEAQIRQEYAWVPREVYTSKRAEILENFLRRQSIYSTELFRSKYEERARRNLTISIRKLRAHSYDH
jgi:predicted metal-dependent HD superfamily phosphohydrolase